MEPWNSNHAVQRDRSLTAIGEKLGGYIESDLEIVPSVELQMLRSIDTKPVGEAWTGLPIQEKEFRIVDFGTNLTGFLGIEIKCTRPATLYMAFDEILIDGDVNPLRMDCVNIIVYELEPGEYRLESFEPYTMRYVKLIAFKGNCEISSITLREYANPSTDSAQFASSDRALNKIFAAARESYRQNALDVFMDCPSRERAGWLCDSFFTARVAMDLSGTTDVERNFLENYALAERFEHLPEGMLPMCYPADHNDGNYIPNWAMWFVIELEEYLARSGDRELVETLRPRVMALLDFFTTYLNSDGLLEKLESWVFVEWSRANDFVQDVNYPSNMLYAATLDAARRIYNLPQMAAAADKIRATILSQSFDGEFFVDNAIRRDGNLEITRNRTEVCQYYAFHLGLASPDTHPELWRKLTQEFGPQRAYTNLHPDIHPANAFIGNYLRMELLARYGLAGQIVAESRDYFLKMADTTGTLWEHDLPQASCNHGFASHMAHVFIRDILGLHSIDQLAKKVIVRLNDIPLEWCHAHLPVYDGFVEMEWWREEGAGIRWKIDVPAGYQVEKM